MLYNRFLENFLLPIGDRIFGLNYLHYLKQYREFCQWSEEAIQELQHERLKETLFHATTNSPYYRELAIEQKSNPIDWLKQYPILTKTHLKEYQNDLLTQGKETLIPMKSSGSSGVQSTVFMTNEELSQHRAAQTLWWEWAGFQIGDRLIQTGINPKRGFTKSLKDFFFRTKYVQAFSHNENDVKHLLKELQGKDGYVLAGYASSLYNFAEIALKHQLENIRFKTAISWGDKVFPHYRNTIQEAFGTPVWETYGTAEGLMMAAQCDNPYLYIMAPNVYLELLDDTGKEVKEGEIGHVVVTSLIAKGMPLIRYQVGDLAIKLPVNEEPADKKLPLPILKKVVGRDTDLIYTPNGNTMVVHSFTGIFEHIPQIKQFRIIQNELESIYVEFIPDKNFKSEVLEKIKNSILSFVNDPQFKIYFYEVEEIPDTASGKPQIIENNMSKK